MTLSPADPEEMQTVLSQKYFVTPEETKSLIDSGTSFAIWNARQNSLMFPENR